MSPTVLLATIEKYNTSRSSESLSAEYCKYLSPILAARKPSLEQGNVFTPVCLFTGVEGVCISGRSAQPPP